MKIVTKNNYNKHLFTEEVIAKDINKHFGEQLVQCWNDKYWKRNSSFHLKLVEDDYKCYDGYKDL